MYQIPKETSDDDLKKVDNKVFGDISDDNQIVSGAVKQLRANPKQSQKALELKVSHYHILVGTLKNNHTRKTAEPFLLVVINIRLVDNCIHFQ